MAKRFYPIATLDLKALTEEELVNRLLDEDCSRREAFVYVKELTRRSHPFLRSIYNVYNVRRVDLDYEDFAQEVFERVFTNLRSLDDRKYFLGYLWTTASRRAVDYSRKPRRTIPQADMDDIESWETHLEEGASDFLHLLVRAHIGQLPSHQQVVLRLVLFDECTPKKAAEQLGIPSSTVRSTKTRALRKLRKLILEDPRFLNTEYVNQVTTVKKENKEERRE